jgi:phosphotransferase system enzyme I (PtsP)
LRRVDFISVGTNDLFQFLFASDRGNYRLSERYDELSPVVLSLLRTVVEQCAEANIPLSLCGEMAGRPLDSMALLGIGFRNISVAPPAVGPLKATIRSLDLSALTTYMETLCRGSQRSLRENLKSYARDHKVVV